MGGGKIQKIQDFGQFTPAQIKVLTLLDLITQLFLTRFLIFLYVSYSAGKMQAIDTKHIKIGQFV